jgi:hypothetical protein
MRLSIKLGALCAIAALVPSVIAAVIVPSKVASEAAASTTRQLEKDSRAAAALYEKRLAEMGAAAARLADQIASRAMVSEESGDRNQPSARARLEDLLTHAQNDLSLDFITVADPQSRIIAQRPTSDQSLLGAEDQGPVAAKMASGATEPVASAVIERGERYGRLGLDRMVRVAGGAGVDEALVIEAAAPILSSGRVSGFVVIGQMLNVYYNPRPKSADGVFTSLQTPLVAEIKQTLYRGPEEDAGALVSLNNIVIASSIPQQGAAAAAQPEPPLVGAAREAGPVISRQGRSYVVAWQPLKTVDGSEVGAVGVARPAAELSGASGSARAIMIVIAALGTALAGGVGFLLGHSIATRINDLDEAAGRWSVGELSTVARDRDPMMSKWVPGFVARDEISRLAGRLEEMRASFRQAIERLRKR